MSIILNGTNGVTNASWTTAGRPSSPVAGQVGFNTTLNVMETYTGSAWVSSDLPAPSTNGNVLTSNGTAWTSSTPASSAGGATQTTTGSNITLTSASNRVQEITPTANITVTLPDATTLSTGTPIFTISNITNQASFTVTINLNGGATIYSMYGGSGVTLALVNNSTAAGSWEINLLPPFTSQGAYAQFDSNSVSGGSSINPNGYNVGRAWNMALSSTTVLTVYRRTTAPLNLYAVAGTVSGSTITYGTPVLINTNAGWNAFMAVGLSSTTALVTAQASATTVLAYGLNISGTTITVSTVSSAYTVNATYSTGISKLNSTQALYSHFSLGQTNYQFNTLTHNGTGAPTFGTISAATTDAYTNIVQMAQIPLTATTTLVTYESSTNFILARVITTSGASAPTLGTSLITTIAANTNNNCNVVPYSATEVAILTYSGITSFTISGTTVTFQANNTNFSGGTLDAMSPIGWGSTTVGVGNYYGTINKYTYTAGGALTKSGLGTTGFSGITYGTSVSFANVVGLSATQYYTVGYNSVSGNTGQGVILTLL
jgi:hypothetical protein